MSRPRPAVWGCLPPSRHSRPRSGRPSVRTAAQAALIVLPAMGLPIELVALLISVEPLIDMGRTALNVSGSMTAGMVTSQLLGQTDRAVLMSPEDVDLQSA